MQIELANYRQLHKERLAAAVVIQHAEETEKAKEKVAGSLLSLTQQLNHRIMHAHSYSCPDLTWSCATTGPSAKRQLVSLELAELDGQSGDELDGDSEYLSDASEDEELEDEDEQSEDAMSDSSESSDPGTYGS